MVLSVSRHFPRNAAFAVAVGSAACVHAVAVPSWEPLDYDGLRMSFANPTATVAQVDAVSADLFAALATNQAVLATSNRLVDRLRELVDESEPQPQMDGADEGPVSGTAVFLELSCPGTDSANPVVDFAQGTLRIDGPRLSREVVERATVEGDLLFTFEDCVDGQVVLDGEATAFYDFEQVETVAIDYDVNAAVGGGDPTLFDFPAIYRPGRIEYLLDAEDGATFVYSYDPADPTIYELRAADGVLDCNAVTQTCVPRS